MTPPRVLRRHLLALCGLAIAASPAAAQKVQVGPPAAPAPAAPAAPAPAPATPSPADPATPAEGTTLVGRVVKVSSAVEVTVRAQGRTVRVRLAGVGDPAEDNVNRGACLRDQAVEYVSGELRRGERVTVRSRDQVTKGAVVGWVYQGTNTGAGSINRGLVMYGLAPVSDTVGRSLYSEDMRAAEQTARSRKAGRWGDDCALSTTAGVQRRLVDLGYLPPGYVNGSLDYRTSQAVMAFQGWSGLTRDGVIGESTRKRLAGAKRPTPRRRSGGRYLEVHVNQQVLLLVKDGRVQRAIHISSGGATPRGSFSIYRRELRSWSVPFSVTLPYAQYFSGGFAFHEYPSVPGYPASHGCVRLPAPEAPVVWEFSNYGTPVSIG